ncbi:MAG: ABC transporter permease [Clostridia bacterium]|nr:ABC transporter permease [Clostridia bacterium]
MKASSAKGRPVIGSLPRLFALAVKKLPAMAGGYVSLVLALAAALLMFFTAHRALETKAPASLRIACVDNDASSVSSELVSMILGANGASVELIECDSLDSAKALAEGGGAEGILVIREALAEHLKNGAAALEYFPSRGASSAQAARELIAGEAVTLGSRLRAEAYFENLSGRAPSAEEKLALEKVYTENRAQEGSAVEKTTVFSGSETEKPAETDLLGAFFARYSGFAAFVIMLILLMLGAFSGSRDEKNCMERISSYRSGRSLGFLSSLASLMLLGLVILALSLIPSGGASLIQFGAGAAYIFCASSLALLLGSISGSARAELASPLIAFLTALAGGCFTDPSALGGGFKTISRFTPQGQYLAALEGETAFIAVLVAAGLILLLLSRLLARAAKRAMQAR